MCMSVLAAYVSIYMHAWCPQRQEEELGSLGTGITNGCEVR